MIARSLGLKGKGEGDERRGEESQSSQLVHQTIELSVFPWPNSVWLVENTGAKNEEEQQRRASEPLVGWYIIPAAKWVAARRRPRYGRSFVLGAKQHRLILGISFGILQSPALSAPMVGRVEAHAAPPPRPATDQILNTKLHYSRGETLSLDRSLGSV